jgi:hypothetical protein
MATQMQGQTQQPVQAADVLDEGVAMFEQGMEIGKQWAEQAARGFALWAEKSPEQVVLVGLAAGFVLGKVFFGARRRALG